MMFWMAFWVVLLTVAVIGFAVLLLLVGSGAIRELKESLAELREDRRRSDEYPDSLDEAI